MLHNENLHCLLAGTYISHRITSQVSLPAVVPKEAPMGNNEMIIIDSLYSWLEFNPHNLILNIMVYIGNIEHLKIWLFVTSSNPEFRLHMMSLVLWWVYPCVNFTSDFVHLSSKIIICNSEHTSYIVVPDINAMKDWKVFFFFIIFLRKGND